MTAAQAQHPQDALAILEADHRAVEQLFDAFERAEKDDLERKTTLVQRACELLSIHSIVEEELLYPAARTALGTDEKIDVDEAYVEHFLVKTLIEKFSQIKAGDEGFDATFKVLSENVKHHVEEEETELFPEIRKTKSVDLIALGKKIEARKEALQNRITEVATAH
ncbi:hemerythrin domain-containing protein [Caballeronia sp. LP006]|uniref:hemerythrin domain-containing protein n=1 Tax=unclassified Caballeronia TaxID=2646786 RepID=UPI002028ECF9|nr:MULTISPECIES: hemerythrin domain-containing protein [unclassified Caballeronia]MDR5775331.1 hemerythrin domain-containing protein [Caballeronia sp. LZ002]MDR5800620.1 hemerythrin domain-containing protein [Caballeronia sp. LZ001]MDR5828881.1 hemerythrin domain-containing protein [Caballeronia sp. LP006]MDR5850769.1 hemerythrin domain-containing protein [Caballeronia sp. LZ003]